MKKGLSYLDAALLEHLIITYVNVKGKEILEDEGVRKIVLTDGFSVFPELEIFAVKSMNP